MINFEKYISYNNLFKKENKLILAISGGIDSMVLAHLLFINDFDFAMAHCNFNLRGAESNKDQELVKKIGLKYQKQVFIKKFRTKSFAKKNKLSIQEAARELRYNWFFKLLHDYKFDFILTAHHANDNLETMIINQLRGTGIVGLHGILLKKDKLIRPLLPFKKQDILKYAKENNIEFREDESNLKDDYLRNAIRHNVIPALKKIEPNVEEIFLKNAVKFFEAEIIYKEKIDSYKNNLLHEFDSEWKIEIEKLRNLPALKTILFEILKTFEFNISTIESIIQAINNQPGKIFQSKKFMLIVERKFLIIKDLINFNSENETFIWEEKNSNLVCSDGKFRFIKKPIKNLKILSNRELAFLDYEKIKFPLKLRKWKDGDSFRPLGMRGRKKISNYFIDEKIEFSEKEKTWILESEGQIVWLVNHRIDNRFKITEKTKKVIVFEYKCNSKEE